MCELCQAKMIAFWKGSKTTLWKTKDIDEMPPADMSLDCSPVQIGICPQSGDPLFAYPHIFLYNYCSDKESPEDMCMDCLEEGEIRQFMSCSAPNAESEADVSRCRAWIQNRRRLYEQYEAEWEQERLARELAREVAKAQEMKRQAQLEAEKAAFLKGIQQTREAARLLCSQMIDVDKGIHNELIRYTRMKVPAIYADQIDWFKRLNRLMNRAQNLLAA